MKNINKGFVVPLIITLAVIIIGVAVYYYSRPQKPTSYLNSALADKYAVLADQNLWNTKLITTDNPEEWTISAKNIVVKIVDSQNNFYCGDKKAVFENYSSFNTGAVGGWGSVSVVDCGSYYFVYDYGDSGPRLYGPFDLNPNNIPNNPTTSSTVFEIGKPFIISGATLSGNSLAPLYTSDKILQNSLVTARVYAFLADACSRGGSADCPLKGEQMVRIDIGIAESIGASWNDKAIYLTSKTYKIQTYRGYTIELVSLNIQNKEATILIRKAI